MFTSTPDGSGTSTKVVVPSWVGTVIAALVVLLGVAGVGLPEDLTEEYILEVIGAALFVVTAILRVVGYVTAERNPPESAIKIIEARKSAEARRTDS